MGVTTWCWDTDTYERAGDLGLFGSRHLDLINGAVFEMSPQSPEHSRVLTFLLTHLTSQAMDEGYAPGMQQPVRISADTELEPDFYIAKGPTNTYAHRHPVGDEIFLAVEVSTSSLDFDLGLKARTYAVAAVPELWVIDVARRSVIVHTEP